MSAHSHPPGQQQPTPQPLPGVNAIIAVGSGKGGVGKTTLSVNLAIALSKMGHKVGLLDGDVYGPVSYTHLDVYKRQGRSRSAPRSA